MLDIQNCMLKVETKLSMLLLINSKSYLEEAYKKQDEFNFVINKLKRQPNHTSPRYTEAKNALLKYVDNFYERGKAIIEGFKNEVFPLIKYDFHSDGQLSDTTGKFDTSSDKSDDLTEKELQIFREIFKQENPRELGTAILRADH